MAEFPADFQNLKESFSSDINILNNINDKFDHNLPSIEQICSSNNLQPFSLTHHQPINILNDGIPSSSSILPTNNINVYDHLAHVYSSSGRDQIHEDTNANKTSESDFLPINPNLSPSGSDLGRGKNIHNGGNEHYNDKKRKRNNCNKELEKSARDVVHVRAKRGQATDSHSLAERVRREKINEKLRSLQDLVPGCYKTMGMAVMLDVIINYVRSLQNQIDFLSMKLSAASLYCDFNSPEIDGMGPTLQGSNNPYDANQSQRMVREGHAGFIPHVQTSWPL